MTTEDMFSGQRFAILAVLVLNGVRLLGKSVFSFSLSRLRGRGVAESKCYLFVYSAMRHSLSSPAVDFASWLSCIGKGHQACSLLAPPTMLL